MRLQMIIDASSCMDCKACLVACHQRNAVPFGKFRNWVHTSKNSVKNGDALGNGIATEFQPGNCMQCKDAPCVEVCPADATYTDELGVVRVIAEECISCGECITACPYGARYRHPVSHIVEKCDYCASSRAQGLEPACVSVCPVHARIFGDIDDPQSEVSKALKKAGKNISYLVPAKSDVQPTVCYIGKTAAFDRTQNNEG